jgi:hypothetical protein
LLVSVLDDALHALEDFVRSTGEMEEAEGWPDAHFKYVDRQPATQVAGKDPPTVRPSHASELELAPPPIELTTKVFWAVSSMHNREAPNASHLLWHSPYVTLLFPSGMK